jgi:DNA-binding transcriptional ArsR family regulator
MFADSANIELEKTTVLTSAFVVAANNTGEADQMAEAALAWLRDRLPQGWEVGHTSRAEFPRSDGRVGTAIDVKGPGGTFTTMVVEVKRVFGPRDVNQILGGVARTLRTLASHIPILVVAPWLSRRSQELLSEQGLNYLDLTGNALIRLDNPAVYLQAQGSVKDPNPPQRSKARVQGPKAGRLIRLLVDVRPPYGVRDLASAAQLTPGYVSRLLDALDDEALVERSKRGRVESVDIGRLVSRWVEAYDVFRANKAQRYLAPAGAARALDQLQPVGSRVAVTGSFAARRLAPVAVPALLAAYVDDVRAVAEALGLIPADHGANVALLTPFDPVVWERVSVVDGLTYVAPSQAAADCLTGNGRMPAEGEALLQWMTADESLWRLDKLKAGGIDG